MKLRLKVNSQRGEQNKIEKILACLVFKIIEPRLQGGRVRPLDKLVTAITALSIAGFQTRHIMTVSGHRNEASARSYVSDTTAVQKRQMLEALNDMATKMTENAEPQTSSGLNDGFDDALCLSLSQME